MKMKLTLGAVAILFASACQSMPSDMRIADYCAIADNQNRDVCQINLEVEGQKKALADTNMSLSEARSIASQAISKSDQALSDAAEAKSLANAALLSEKELSCETRTINKSDTGSCEAGYTLMSCTQTRYTTRAGGLSFLREIDNKSCRFNSRVLEMQVRCCKTAAANGTIVNY